MNYFGKIWQCRDRYGERWTAAVYDRDTNRFIGGQLNVEECFSKREAIAFLRKRFGECGWGKPEIEVDGSVQ